MNREQVRALIAKEIVGSFRMHYRRNGMELLQAGFVERACIDSADAVILGLQEWAVKHQAEVRAHRPKTEEAWMAKLISQYFSPEEIANIKAHVPDLGLATESPMLDGM